MRGLLYIFSRCKRDVGQTGRQAGRRSQRRVRTKNDLEWTIAANPQSAPQPCLGYRKKILLGQQHHGAARLDGEGEKNVVRRLRRAEQRVNYCQRFFGPAC